MTKKDPLLDQLKKVFADEIRELSVAFGEITLECAVISLKTLLHQLRDNQAFLFDQLMDVCGVDYLYYGQYDWETDAASSNGFSRGVEVRENRSCDWKKPRFAVVYHLLSTQKNHRLRVKVFVEEADPIVPSVIDLWKAANWFEREAYDLYGILFEGHPDLRRILTDYGFIGHPFRKDFPVSGHVEMRYDATLKKVIYEPVDIEPRILVPKVIRKDSRYADAEGEK